MLSRICIANFLIAGGILSLVSAEFAPAITFSEFQKLFRTGLDSELEKISHATTSSTATPNLSGQLYSDGKSYVRRRTSLQDSELESSKSPYAAELMWNELIQHAWNLARTIKRGRSGGLSITEIPNEAHAWPFLVCARRRKNLSLDSSGVEDIDIAAHFDKHHGESSLVSSSHAETCVLLTTTALKVGQVLGDTDGRLSLVAVPLVDIAKIHYGTIDEVTSQGWLVPFHEQHGGEVNDKQSPSKNQTEALNDWERVIEVNFVPGLGGMMEEAQLLSVVNEMMGDIQDMGEVGWLKSQGSGLAEKYLMHQSLTGVPAMSDMFSLTSSLHVNADKEATGNARIKFWQDQFRNGIEAEHTCSEMFSTLFVRPRAGYYGYDLVLNPGDGPPPQDYESSASNPACVVSLIAGLSAHPYVLSVRANFPIYHGWHIAQKLDTFQAE